MKAILFANTDWYLFNFRLSLAKALREAGYEVTLISPPGEYGAKIISEGFQWQNFPLERRGMNPLKELRTIARLYRFYRAERPDIVHHFTIKCVLYGSLVAHLVGIRKVINSITGLGYIFISESRLVAWLRPFIHLFYRLALRKTSVIFQNPDDIALFQRHRLLGKANTRLILGSGVDTDLFTFSPEPPGEPVVMLAGRFLWDKGIGEFISAVRQLKHENCRARFVLVGDTYADNPAAVSPEQLQRWVHENVVEWWGWRDDMRAVLPQAHIVCLPSYREGLPRSLAEAGACGRPVVATDVPGCRVIIKDGVNGLLVPVRDAAALAAALAKLINNPAMRQEMGRKGRKLVEINYSVRRIVTETLQVYNET